jgi:AcrR family transcriptional regulator
MAMGRPRLHGDRTREDLLAAAEVMVAEHGADALTLRRLAAATGTTTRAVYSLFGNREGLISALYRQAFEVLIRRVEALPETPDPLEDLKNAALDGFRAYALEHPNLFRLVFEHMIPEDRLAPGDLTAGSEARDVARRLVQRCVDAGLFGDRPADLVVSEFHALAQGLAAMELQGRFRGVNPLLVWGDAMTALMAGLTRPALAASPAAPRRRSRRVFRVTLVRSG